MTTPRQIAIDTPLPINESSPLPYYCQVKEYLLEQIQNGDWRPGDQLPGEFSLCEVFGVSRTVIRQASQEMVQRGFLYREKGKGTFVADPKISQPVSLLKGFDQKMREAGHTTQTEVLGATTVLPSIHTRVALRLSGDEQVFELKRLRYVDGEPTALHTAYLPVKVFPNLLGHDLTGSLTTLMREVYGLRLTAYNADMEPVLADSFLARVLHVREGQPLMLIEGTTAGQHNQPVRYAKCVYRADKLRFLVEGFTITEKVSQ